MGYHKCVLLIVLLNFCVMLCASLPLTYNEAGRAGSLFEKLFPGEERSIRQDSFSRYPWSRDERTGLFPSEGRQHDEDKESKLQIEQVMREREIKKNLLKELLEWEKRRLDQNEQSETTNEKREPQRCAAGQFGGCGKRREVLHNKMALMDSKAGPGFMDDKDIDRIKQYDAEMQRALQELGVVVRSNKKM